MHLSRRFKLNKPFVTYQILAEEIVIVHLETGTYYSLDYVGTFIWNGLMNGYPTQQILEDIYTHYEEVPETTEKEIIAFVLQLQEEKLIVQQKEIELTFNFYHPYSQPLSIKSPFVSPCLNKYTEMQELLLLDPLFESEAQTMLNLAFSSF
ncbi:MULTISPECIES: PqqD family protein [Parachlamydia]|jgi:hypothetical protein|uniref:PqqD family protein n=2 Tax=Parachlamydia acanthamoebae TaxID=83552 RepID=F8L169_PARAV|nr:PqqD family protein [Parachlamydia acanthamoebae]EFB42539.1 hypothetical protein pah_c004o027 [Parachlamydia acanthamoebae str. Hall's coccus]CCB86988.1 putative uncharacterized protein [Parachlamydia acanthamoebae UV-7]